MSIQIVLRIKDEWIQDFKSKGGHMPGWIYLEMNQKFYPDDDWIDNPIVILGWWLNSIRDVLNGRENQGICFMEGPFFIEAIDDGKNLALKSEDGEVNWVVDKTQFAKEIIRVSNQLIRDLYSSDLRGKADALAEGVKLVNDALSQTRNPGQS